MEPATSQNQLLDQLIALGWRLKKIDFRNGNYVAKADNKATGHEVERTAKSPDMAILGVLQYAQRANQVRAFAGLKKVATWATNWMDQKEEIAQAYRELPPFDEKAVEAWRALAVESKVQADAVRKQVDVEVVDDPEPYRTTDEMVQDVRSNKHFFVSRAGLNHPMWSDEDCINFRIVHDVIGHCQSGGDFSWNGENIATAVHMPLVSPPAREALFVETIGTAAYFSYYRGIGPKKVALMSSFLQPVQEQEGERVFVPYGGQPNMFAPVQHIETPAINQQEMLKNTPPSPAFEQPNVMNGWNVKPQRNPRQLRSKMLQLVKGENYGQDRKAQETTPASFAASKEAAKRPLAQEVSDHWWPEWEHIDQISQQTVVPHQGYRDTGLIEGAVGNARMSQMYGQHDDIFATAADIIAKVQRQQAVVEGNKRTATALGLHWLQENGYDVSRVSAEPFWSALVEAIWQISDAADPTGQEAIDRTAQILREACVPMDAQREAKVYDWAEDVRIAMPVTRPKYVDPYLEGLAGPGEQHETPNKAQQGLSCPNPKCRYVLTSADMEAAEWQQGFDCPSCGYHWEINPFGDEPQFEPAPMNETGGKGYKLNPGGITHSTLTVSEMGDIGEAVVFRIEDLPGLGKIRRASAAIQFPIDGILDTDHGSYGIEIKSNHSKAQERFKIGGAAERKAKLDYCAQNGLKPALIGVRLNFYTNKAYLFFREGLTDTWVGNAKMQHVGTYDFADINPFKAPTPEAQKQSVDAAEIPDQSLSEEIFAGWKEATQKEDPNYIFIWYKSELRMEKWEHSRSHADILEDLFDEFGQDFENDYLGVDPSEVAAGLVYEFSDGSYKVEHEQMNDPEIREYAEEAISNWMVSWTEVNSVTELDRDPETGQFVSGWVLADVR